METGLVRYLESRARAWRLAYDHATPPRHLLEAVLSREHAHVGALGPGAMPGCFGGQFAGPYDPACDSCRVQVACAARLAWDVIPELDSQAPGDIAAALRLDPKAVALVQAFARAAAQKEPEPFGGYQLLPKPTRPKACGPQSIPRPFGLLAWAAVVGSRGRHKTFARDIVRTEHVAGTRLLAFARAAYFKPPPKSDAWAQRHANERKRNRLYAQLKTGMLLRKVHKGILHEVRVGRGGYDYEGQRYPTLYAVVQAIGGSIACEGPVNPLTGRARGTRYTAIRSPLIFFGQAFRQLVDRVPPRKKPPKKAKKPCSDAD